MTKKIIIEIIATSFDDGVLAQKFGANRLELIHGFEYGGLSPNLHLTKNLTDILNIPVNVMLRTSPNMAFNYSKTDMCDMLKELEYLRDHTKVAGVVFGALNRDMCIDTKQLEEIIKNKGHLTLTFHRAIDISKNIIDSYKLLLEYQEVDHVLTSGGADTAILGIRNIQEMVELGKNNQNAKILVGSGLTPENVSLILSHTQVGELHLGTGVRTNGELDEYKFKQLLENLSV